MTFIIEVQIWFILKYRISKDFVLTLVPFGFCHNFASSCSMPLFCIFNTSFEIIKFKLTNLGAMNLSQKLVFGGSVVQLL